MGKSFSDRLKELIERLEECDDLPDIIRELKWLAEDIEKREAEAPCGPERRGL